MNFKPIIFESVPQSGLSLQDQIIRPVSQVKGRTGAVQVCSVPHACPQSLTLRHELPRHISLYSEGWKGRDVSGLYLSQVSHGPLASSSRYCSTPGLTLFLRCRVLLWRDLPPTHCLPALCPPIRASCNLVPSFPRYAHHTLLLNSPCC